MYTHTYTTRAFLWYSRLYANSPSIYLRLLLLILERIFPFRFQPFAVIVKVINDRYLHVLRLHLSLSQLAHFLLRGWRIPVRWRAETAPHQEEHRLPSSSWRSPPPPPPAADAAAPLVCLVVCPCAAEKAGLESHDSRKPINYSHKVSKLKVGGYSTMLHLMPKLENVKLPEEYYRLVELA